MSRLPGTELSALSRVSDARGALDLVLNWGGVLAILVVGVLMVFIVPRIAEQFTSLDVTLPLITRIMIALSQFLQAAWLWLLVGIAAAALAGACACHRQRRGARRPCPLCCLVSGRRSLSAGGSGAGRCLAGERAARAGAGRA